MAIKTVNALSHYTDWTIGHVLRVIFRCYFPVLQRHFPVYRKHEARLPEKNLIWGERGVAARITSPGPGLGAASKLGDSARITLPRIVGRIAPQALSAVTPDFTADNRERLFALRGHVEGVAQVVVTAVQCQVALVDAVHADILASHAAQAAWGVIRPTACSLPV